MISLTRGKVIAGMLVVFLLGMLAGSGLGTAYGRNARVAEQEQRLAEQDRQLQAANDNYLILVREYNKLFGLRSAAVASASLEVKPVTAAAPAAAAPASPPTSAAPPPAAAAPTAAPPAMTPTTAPEPAATAAPTDAPTPAPTDTPAAAGQPWADFEANSRTGGSPLEGPPPQTFDFTDLSSGQITSWEWDFGDGGTSTEQNPEHTYTECPDDLCTVTLKVCGPGGCDTKTKLDYLHVSASCSGC